ncbi:MAG: hypothetical protein R6W06_06895, partial [Prochlorococcaceae cyanobacterium]
TITMVARKRRILKRKKRVAFSNPYEGADEYMIPINNITEKMNSNGRKCEGTLAPLDDYKFYCFGGRTEFVVHMWKSSRRPHKRSAAYTRDWDPVEVIAGTQEPWALATDRPGPGRLA